MTTLRIYYAILLVITSGYTRASLNLPVEAKEYKTQLKSARAALAIYNTVPKQAELKYLLVTNNNMQAGCGLLNHILFYLKVKGCNEVTLSSMANSDEYKIALSCGFKQANRTTIQSNSLMTGDIINLRILLHAHEVDPNHTYKPEPS